MLNKNQDLPYKNNVFGILLVNKPRGKTSFSLVSALRRLYNIQKIGHAGTLDPFATGVMILLVGKQATRLSDQFLHQDKKYIATLHLGIETDSYDCDGLQVKQSDHIPSLEDIQSTLNCFQGTIEQTPPMFSAKKVKGKKLYELARKGIEIERKAEQVTLQTTLLHYEYPFLSIKVSCSKGTYIRSLASDIGKQLGCGAHLCNLCRTRSGSFTLSDCVDGDLLYDPNHRPLPKLLSPEQIGILSTKP